MGNNMKYLLIIYVFISSLCVAKSCSNDEKVLADIDAQRQSIERERTMLEYEKKQDYDKKEQVCIKMCKKHGLLLWDMFPERGPLKNCLCSKKQGADEDLMRN
jgi:hypothetical protein